MPKREEGEGEEGEKEEGKEGRGGGGLGLTAGENFVPPKAFFFCQTRLLRWTYPYLVGGLPAGPAQRLSRSAHARGRL